MLTMIFPMIIASVGWFLAHTGSTSRLHIFTIVGCILIFVAILWFSYIVGYNIGYALY